jgi:steroid delta-isomerase-like uncharacterized protein
MAETTPTMRAPSTEWVEEFVDSWFTAWNSHDPHRVLALMTDDVVYEDSMRSEPMRGHAEVRQFLGEFWRAFPDYTVELLERPLLSSDSPRVSFRWRGTGTNSGPIDPPGLPATDKRIEHTGADFHEYREGKVAQLQILFDNLIPLRQLGVLPDWDSFR